MNPLTVYRWYYKKYSFKYENGSKNYFIVYIYIYKYPDYLNNVILS